VGLADYQMNYNGLDFGAGYDIGIQSIEGFDDFSADLGNTSIPRGTGDVPGLAVARARSIVLYLKVKEAKRSVALADRVNEAYRAFTLSQSPTALSLKDPGQPERFVNCRVIGRTFRRVPELTHGYHPFVVRLQAADPRFYGATAFNQGLGVYSASGGGMDYDLVDYGKEYALDTAASIVVTNDGNAEAFPVIAFFGPVTGTMTGATLTNITNGSVADFVFTSALVTGGTFVADMQRIVTAAPGTTPYISQGGTNRYGDWQLPRAPFFLSPGTNELRFEITGTSTDATASVTWRDTSL